MENEHEHHTRHPRLDFQELTPEASKSLFALSAAVRRSSLDAGVRELVSVYVSQLNGCAHCIAVHWGKATAAGVAERALQMLPAAEEAGEMGLFTDKERVALRLARRLTVEPRRGVDDALWDEARRRFGDEGLMWLIQQIMLMNAWNRLSIALRLPPPER